MPKKLNLTGARFGRLTAISEVADPRPGSYWRCQCDCGGSGVFRGGSLSDGHTQSCGCLVRERVANLHTFQKTVLKHGGAGKARDSTYGIWRLMLSRCENPGSISFRNYGRRGITVCDRWKDYRNFRSDMGPRPPGTSLERSDNNVGYFPGNCVWATGKQQGRNKRNNVKLFGLGTVKTLPEWAEILGLKYHRLYRLCVTKKMSISEVITKFNLQPESE